MRKRNVNHFFDELFWYIVYLFPVIAFLFCIPNFGTETNALITFEYFFESIGLGFVTDNLIISVLRDIFGINGIMPIFSTDAVFIMVSWFITTFLVHLCVDFILFIPRLTHKWLGKCVSDD